MHVGFGGVGGWVGGLHAQCMHACVGVGVHACVGVGVCACMCGCAVGVHAPAFMESGLCMS